MPIAVDLLPCFAYAIGIVAFPFFIEAARWCQPLKGVPVKLTDIFDAARDGDVETTQEVRSVLVADDAIAESGKLIEQGNRIANTTFASSCDET